MRYIGRIVPTDCYKFDRKNVKALTDLVKRKTKTAGDVRRVLEMVVYLIRYIPGFSKTADPLYHLLKKGDNMDTSSKTRTTSKDDHQQALNTLLLAIAEAAILAYPDYEKEFNLHIDVSCKGNRAVLLQHQGDKLRVIGYRSRTITVAEMKYHCSKLESLILKWTKCNHFRD